MLYHQSKFLFLVSMISSLGDLYKRNLLLIQLTKFAIESSNQLILCVCVNYDPPACATQLLLLIHS